jgi:hypothetical protein
VALTPSRYQQRGHQRATLSRDASGVADLEIRGRAAAD